MRILSSTLKTLCLLSFLIAVGSPFAADTTSESIERLAYLTRLKTLQINALILATSKLLDKEKPRDLLKDQDMQSVLKAAKELHRSGLVLFTFINEKKKAADTNKNTKPVSDYTRKNYATVIYDMESKVEEVMQALVAMRYLKIEEAEKLFYIDGIIRDKQLSQLPYAKNYTDRVAQLISHLRLPGGDNRLGRKMLNDEEASPEEIAENFMFGNEGDFVRYSDLSAFLK